MHGGWHAWLKLTKICLCTAAIMQARADQDKIKHIGAKPSALSQNPSQLLARMRRCVRVILSTLTSYSRPRPAPKALGVVASSKLEGTARARHVKHHAS